MDWDKLRVFHTVAEAGSFTHAGEVLGLSQSAVSRQISTLEDSLGVSLFHRHARGLILTEQGDVLHKTARDIFAKLSMIEGQIMDSRQLSEGPLRITVAEFIGSTWLAPRLSVFQKENPDIQLTLLLDDRIYNLGMREADAALRLHKPEQPDLIQRHMATLDFYICASKAYLAKSPPVTQAEDLSAHTLLGYPENIPAPFTDPNWIFRLTGAGADTQNVGKRMMINSMYGILMAVLSGTGIAALPHYLIQDHADSLEILLPDLRRPSVDMYFVYPEERRHSRRIDMFRDFLIRQIEKTSFHA